MGGCCLYSRSRGDAVNGTGQTAMETQRVLARGINGEDENWRRTGSPVLAVRPFCMSVA